MRPIALDITQHGSLGGTKVNMSFDENSIVHLMGVLTDLYSDSELAVIREYSTNAHDSHVASGQTRPIEVTLPTELSPYLVIKDFGLGMSTDDIADTYSKYGASTKRNTNSQSGTLGLGCKSALTYTAQFSVSAVKDGMKTIVNVSRGADGAGVMEVVDTSPSTEPQGVTVTIPVKNIYSLRRKAQEFFIYWHPRTVLVDGQEPSQVVGIEITDNITLLDKESSSDYIVMGNVAYEVEEEYSIAKPASYWKHSGVVAWVPIGSVEFTPNREGLRYTAHTKTALDKLRKEFEDGLSKKLSKEIDECSTSAEALHKWATMQSKFSDLGAFKVVNSWRGKSFKAFLDGLYYTKFNLTATRNQTRYTSYLDADAVVDGVFVVDRPDVQISTVHKAKIRQLVEDNGLSPRYVYIIKNDQNVDDWLDQSKVFTWTEVVSVKLPRNSNYNGPRGKQRYKLVTATGSEEVDDLDTSRPIYYDSPKDFNYSHARRVFDLNVDQVVLLNANRHNKFLRDYPTAKTVSDGIYIKRQEYLDTVPQDVVDSLSMDRKHFLKALDPSKIDDPDLIEDIKLAHLDTSRWNDKFCMWGGKSSGRKQALSKYSLLQTYFSRLHEHTYVYINAVYNEG